MRRGCNILLLLTLIVLLYKTKFMSKFKFYDFLNISPHFQLRWNIGQGSKKKRVLCWSIYILVYEKYSTWGGLFLRPCWPAPWPAARRRASLAAGFCTGKTQVVFTPLTFTSNLATALPRGPDSVRDDLNFIFLFRIRSYSIRHVSYIPLSEKLPVFKNVRFRLNLKSGQLVNCLISKEEDTVS